MSGNDGGMVMLGLGLILGGAIGAYAGAAIQGETPALDPDPAPRIAQQCPPCPPPMDCGEPSATMVEGDEGAEDESRTFAALDPTRPGLPISAAELASRAIDRSIKSCGPGTGTEVKLALNLVVTATSGVGRVAKADVAQQEGSDPDRVSCVLESVRSVEFDWNGADGEMKLLHPLDLEGL